MSLCHYFAVNILLFLICLDKHISRDYFFFTCASVRSVFELRFGSLIREF